MIKRNLYFKDGILFADAYERVVHGGRGDFIELSESHIKIILEYKFKKELPTNVIESFYYVWLQPKDRNEKIYMQQRAVKYADYKIGFYYISPNFLLPFDECKELF